MRDPGREQERPERTMLRPGDPGSRSQRSQAGQPPAAAASPFLLTGRRVAAAIALWLMASVVVAGLTFVGVRAIAPASAGTANATATVIAAEVYTILIATLLVTFGGYRGAPAALQLRAVPARGFVFAFALFGVVLGVEVVAYLLAGTGHVLGQWYLRIGTDGGRLGTLDLVTTLLSLARACVLAPVGEELLFRGAIYGWSRRWLPAWPAIVLNGIVWGTFAGTLGGSLPQAPLAFCNGVAITWIREHTNSTLPGIAVHVAYNTLVVIVIFVLIGWR